MCGATTLQSFAAGCALSSTSLGTTFTILKSSGLSNTRLGTVLSSAAMLDDVVGLVLVQVITNLGASAEGSFSAITIIRPVFVSFGYAALVPILLYLFNSLGPKTHLNFIIRGRVAKIVASRQARFVYYTAILIAAVTSASYAGTSNLFAAYLAGLVISSRRDAKHRWPTTKEASKPDKADSDPVREADSTKLPGTDDTNDTWEMVAGNSSTPEHKDVVFKEPIQPDTHPEQAGSHKFSDTSKANHSSISSRKPPTSTIDTDNNIYETYYATIVNKLLKAFFFGSISFSIPITRLFDAQTLWRGIVFSLLMALGKLACGIWLIRFSRPAPPPTLTNNNVKKAWSILLGYRPQSLYPANILGSAMVARGEIGFLISAIAQSNGIFEKVGDDGEGDLFLVVTWAILLCTIVGPVSVGLLTRRVKRLRRDSSGARHGRGDPLGVWADM